MSEEEKDYSTYVESISNWYSGLLFLAGFTLTAMTILIANISEPISFSAQLILLFFGIMFQLTLSVTAFLNLSISILCKNLPKNTPHESILVPLVFLVNIMSQFGVALLFLYRNLIYLALISARAHYICNTHYLWSVLPEAIPRTYETSACIGERKEHGSSCCAR